MLGTDFSFSCISFFFQQGLSLVFRNWMLADESVLHNISYKSYFRDSENWDTYHWLDVQRIVEYSLLRCPAKHSTDNQSLLSYNNVKIFLGWTQKLRTYCMFNSQIVKYTVQSTDIVESQTGNRSCNIFFWPFFRPFISIAVIVHVVISGLMYKWGERVSLHSFNQCVAPFASFTYLLNRRIYYNCSLNCNNSSCIYMC